MQVNTLTKPSHLKNIPAYEVSKKTDVRPPQLRWKQTPGGDLYHSIKDKERGFAKVSAVIITYNEAAIISQTLSKLDWCDEVIIIDSGSTDETLEICKEYGCIIFHRAFNGFGEQKKFGVTKTKNDWVLFIDADELLTDSLIKEIQFELNKPEVKFAGFEMSLNLVFMNRIFKYGKETDCRRIRLFNKNSGIWDDSLVHEKINMNGRVKRLENKIHHYSYTSYSQFLQKIDLYSGLSAKKIVSKKTKKTKAVIALGLPFNFFKYYVIDRNFLNGYQGFAWAVLNSVYHFVKYLKAEELQKTSKTSSGH